MSVTKNRFHKTVCVDFDGVIHSYTSGWQGVDKIPDKPVPGAIEWLNEFGQNEDYRLVIYSARSKEDIGIEAMKGWLESNGCLTSYLDFASEKPAAWLTIDDRSIQFRGTFPSDLEMSNFKPWNR